MCSPILPASAHNLASAASENKTSVHSLGGPRYEKRKSDDVAFNLRMGLIVRRRLLADIFKLCT